MTFVDLSIYISLHMVYYTSKVYNYINVKKNQVPFIFITSLRYFLFSSDKEMCGEYDISCNYQQLQVLQSMSCWHIHIFFCLIFDMNHMVKLYFQDKQNIQRCLIYHIFEPCLSLARAVKKEGGKPNISTIIIFWILILNQQLQSI